MIVPITGNVVYPITLDPSVWIFDDRKIEFEKAFATSYEPEDGDDELKKAAERWNKEVSPKNYISTTNRGIGRSERKEILKRSYVMPIKPFIENAEPKSNARHAILMTRFGNETIALERLKNSFLLFSKEGKPLKEDGPVHLYDRDGSNQNNPIKGIQKIIVD
ncbi:MAG TPA: hypothetical protein VK136_00950 [Bacillota bacterium]|nr:hypothetical protein [Bacillota bacterium]